MTFFGTSKSKKRNPPPPPPPQPLPRPLYNPQPHSRRPYAIVNPPNGTPVIQRPNTSRGYGGGYSYGRGPAPLPPVLRTPPPQYQQFQPSPRTQNLLLLPPPPQPLWPQNPGASLSRLNLASVVDLLSGDAPPCIPGARIFNEGTQGWGNQGAQYLHQGSALYDLISSKFDAVVTLIDCDRFSGDERELVVFQPPPPMWQQQQQPGYASQELVQGKSKGFTNNTISSALTHTNYFDKVNLYANSRLRPNLPPMKLYISTFPLLCLAAQYSERVYSRPSGKEKETHVDSDWRMGTKAMVIKSVPMDDMNTIVFAIRGTQTFMDWAVNLNSAPMAPEAFLDDTGNNCHAGFLTVARKMVAPVASRLRHLLQEDPARSKYSLMITGHSAGGAVAALLYSHMLSTSREAESELNMLTGCFKRIHCVTFGAPPVSLLPLTKPATHALRKSIFLSFINEGDPVPRANTAYVRSLLDLYSTPAPGQSCLTSVTPHKLHPLLSGFGGKSSSSVAVNTTRPSPKHSKSAPAPGSAPIWPVPQATLSNAGRLVLLRSVEKYEGRRTRKKHVNERMNEGIVAQIVTDEDLRTVIWGDPMCHTMTLYSRRIEILATNAVMGRG